MRCSAAGLADLETIVIDDGSVHPAPASLLERFPWIRLERCAESYGLIIQRNRLARMMTSPYYLSLDDDSFPVAGNLSGASVPRKYARHAGSRVFYSAPQ